MQNGNGLQQSKPFAKIADIAPKQPRTWGTALEVCRAARGWSQKQLVSEALRGENVSASDVKRWELARDWPTLNMMNKIRAAMPEMEQYDELAKLDLRASPRMKGKTPGVPVKPEGWSGPPVEGFHDALAWARRAHGISQRDLAAMVGLTNVGPWERAGYVMIEGTYEELLKVLPELRYAPKPIFSVKFKNQKLSKGFLVKQERLRDQERAQKIVEPGTPAPAAPVVPRGPDTAPLNSAGAQYGVLAANLIGLEAEKAKMERRHLHESEEMEARIEKAKGEMQTARAHVLSTAESLHGGMP